MLYDIESVTEAKKFADQGYSLMETDDIDVLMRPEQQGAYYGL